MVSQLVTIEKGARSPYNGLVLEFEWTSDLRITDICGIDEAGRGPLAGPVTAAAVVLPEGFPLELLGDSKKLSEPQRERALEKILTGALGYSVGWAWPEEIDRMNIHNATLVAMERAFRGISLPIRQVLVDGKYTPPLEVSAKAIIKGDGKIPAIMAASILAKSARDRWMIRYSWIEEGYGFEKHKGYPTREHAESCRRLGLSPIHRKTFHIPLPKDNPDNGVLWPNMQEF